MFCMTRPGIELRFGGRRSTDQPTPGYTVNTLHLYNNNSIRTKLVLGYQFLHLTCSHRPNSNNDKICQFMIVEKFFLKYLTQKNYIQIKIEQQQKIYRLFQIYYKLTFNV